MSTGSIPPSPNAIAASACTPPMAKTRSAPQIGGGVDDAPGGCVPSRRGGAHATTVSTPATFGTSTVMNGDASSGNAARRQVRADPLHRHEPVTGDDARGDLDLEVGERRALRPGERLDPLARALAGARAAPGRSLGAVDLRAGELEVEAAPSRRAHARSGAARPRRRARARAASRSPAARSPGPRVADLASGPFEEQQVLVVEQSPRDHAHGMVSQRAVRHNPGLPSLSTG